MIKSLGTIILIFWTVNETGEVSMMNRYIKTLEIQKYVEKVFLLQFESS